MTESEWEIANMQKEILGEVAATTASEAAETWRHIDPDDSDYGTRRRLAVRRHGENWKFFEVTRTIQQTVVVASTEMGKETQKNETFLRTSGL